MLGKLKNFIKTHKKTSIIIALALVLLIAVCIPAGLNTKRTHDARQREKAYWVAHNTECRAKSTENKVQYSYSAWDPAYRRMLVRLVADVSTKEKPELYIDDTKVEPLDDELTVAIGYNCEGAGKYYHTVTAELPATCLEKKMRLKTSKYDLKHSIEIQDSCKTKEQQEAEKKAKAEADVKKKADDERKKQEAADRKAREQAQALAANPYEKLGTQKVQNYRANIHYKLNSTTKPSLEQVRQYMVEIQRKGCDGPQTCNFFLWTTKAAYEAGKNNVDGMASEVASRHKTTLAGYVNSGYAFYYYGTTSSTQGRTTIMDPDTGTYIEF